MRHYQFQATDETIEALRLLRDPWAAYAIAPAALTVRLADGRSVRIAPDEAHVEDGLDASRLRAEPVTAPLDDAGVTHDAPDFARGRNDVVVLTGATWLADGSDGDAARRTLFSGSLQQLPEDASAVCLTTDAVVVATGAGSGVLVRTGLAPRTIDVIVDQHEIARFLRSRGYVE
ncbi:MAG: hypothetical protein MUF21_12260 [Gemmatimonadaceae bacterium]|jgi:hypothetical protein|nr:hypothetical protein [Gemmatimonadaceae bacterium]